MAVGMDGSGVEHLLGVQEALASVPSTEKSTNSKTRIKQFPG